MSGVSTTDEDPSYPLESNTDVSNRTSEECIPESDSHANIPTESKNTASNKEQCTKESMQNNENDYVADFEQQKVANEKSPGQTTTENQKQSQDSISEANENHNQDVEHTKTKVRFAEDRISIKDEIRLRNKICIITKKTGETTNVGKRKSSLKSKMALLSASSQISEDEITKSESLSSISTESKITENNEELQSNAYDQVTDFRKQQVDVPSDETGSQLTTTENPEQDSFSETVGQQDVVHLKTNVRIDKAGLHRSLSIKEEVRSRNNICIITNETSETNNDGKLKPSIKAKIALLAGKNLS